MLSDSAKQAAEVQSARDSAAAKRNEAQRWADRSADMRSRMPGYPTMSAGERAVFDQLARAAFFADTVARVKADAFEKMNGSRELAWRSVQYSAAERRRILARSIFVILALLLILTWIWAPRARPIDA